MDQSTQDTIVAVLKGIGSLIPIAGVGAAIGVAAQPLVSTLADLLDGEEAEPATIAQLEAVNNQLKALPPLPGGED